MAEVSGGAVAKEAREDYRRGCERLDLDALDGCVGGMYEPGSTYSTREHSVPSIERS